MMHFKACNDHSKYGVISYYQRMVERLLLSNRSVTHEKGNISLLLKNTLYLLLLGHCT